MLNYEAELQSLVFFDHGGDFHVWTVFCFCFLLLFCFCFLTGPKTCLWPQTWFNINPRLRRGVRIEQFKKLYKHVMYLFGKL